MQCLLVILHIFFVIVHCELVLLAGGNIQTYVKDILDGCGKRPAKWL